MSSKGVAPQHFIDEAAKANDDEDPFAETRRQKISDRQSQYQRRAQKRPISPERADMFSEQTPDVRDRTYAQIMQEQILTAEKEKVERELADKHQKGELRVVKSAKFHERKGSL